MDHILVVVVFEIDKMLPLQRKIVEYIHVSLKKFETYSIEKML
jgi:hypothetical protein